MAIDYARAMAAYKVGGEGGNATCQFQIGTMYCRGLGTTVDYKQARVWLEKAAAQDYPNAVGTLGVMCAEGWGVTPSWRRTRELFKRANELGGSMVVEAMQAHTQSIQKVS